MPGMSLPDHDIAILGGGPAGSALALLLARTAPRPDRIALFRAPLRGAGHAADPRSLAMNHGSQVLLESLGAWPRVAAEIRTVHVSQRARLGRTLIRHDDYGVPRLGSVAGYTALHQALAEAVAKSGVQVIEDGQARLARHDAQGATIEQAGRAWSCGVAVQADGTPGDAATRDYDQHAVLTLARASLPRAGWAWERFTQEGPLALLPHPAGPDVHSVVWCCRPDRARQLQAMDEAEFSRALNTAFGTRLGRLSAQRPDGVFPLALRLRPALAEGRTAAIGNAAQTLHPVAGQGLNLGLRDAARLALSLAGWLRQADTDPTPLLAQYAQARQPDRRVTAGVTDFLPRVFATGLPAVEHACGLALLGLDLAAPLRAPLARHLLQGLRA